VPVNGNAAKLVPSIRRTVASCISSQNDASPHFSKAD